jgi:hypothetical protein
MITKSEAQGNFMSYVKANMSWILLTSYIVLSLIFILYVLVYQRIVVVSYNAGAQAGYQTAVSDLVTQLQKSQCQPLPINLGQSKVEILNAECVKEQTPATTGASK